MTPGALSGGLSGRSLKAARYDRGLSTAILRGPCPGGLPSPQEVLHPGPLPLVVKPKSQSHAMRVHSHYLRLDGDRFRRRIRWRASGVELQRKNHASAAGPYHGIGFHKGAVPADVSYLTPGNDA